jgi:hypothetical protein
MSGFPSCFLNLPCFMALSRLPVGAGSQEHQEGNAQNTMALPQTDQKKKKKKRVATPPGVH